MRQVAFEIGDHVGEALLRQVIGGARVHRALRPHRRHHGDGVGDVVEHRHHRRPHEDAVGNAEPVGVGVGQPLDQPDHAVAHIAEQAGRHRRQRLRRLDPALGDERAQRGERPHRRRHEPVGVDARAPVELGAPAGAAPDQVGLDADHGIAADLLAALDRLEQEAHRPPVGELEHGRYRSLEIGDQHRPYQHGLAERVTALKLVEIRRDLHG